VRGTYVAGQCNLFLSNQKEKVLEQMSELSQIQKMLVAKEAQVKKWKKRQLLWRGRYRRHLSRGGEPQNSLKTTK